MKKLTYNPKGEDYGFILFPAKFDDEWEDISVDNHIFIYFSDFEYLLDSIRKVYPLLDPETNTITTSFDVCGVNCINVVYWSEIIDHLNTCIFEEVELKKFVSDFCSWIIEKQKGADEIIVKGTV